MTFSDLTKKSVRTHWTPWRLLILAFVLTAAVYWPGLSGNYLFDDYPNIVDNKGVQPTSSSLSTLINAALSSPASDFKRPLASLSFAANYLLTGLDPYWMKLTNLIIHLLNGWLVFLLARELIGIVYGTSESNVPSSSIVAVVTAISWMLLPINLTSVLYVVQRMESMANLFVLIGLIGYARGRKRMLRAPNTMEPSVSIATSPVKMTPRSHGYILCVASLIVPSVIGALAKETAVMLPLYAALVEWTLFRPQSRTNEWDLHIVMLFVVVLLLPMITGLAWLLPTVLNSNAWSARNFTLATRLLSEARIVSDYVVWTLLPTPHALSFYHDNFPVSTSLLSPWTTLVSAIFLACLMTLTVWLRRRQPLVALGLALFLGAQLLTCSILPLELIYEHRNYFASFGLLLAFVPLLTAPKKNTFIVARWTLLGGLIVCWLTLTAVTAYSWGNPLRLAYDLAERAPDSPRAQYELGRTYIIYSHYDSASPFTRLAYAPLEKAASLPGSSILPQQALIFMNSRMHLPLKDSWWDSMIRSLQARNPTVQDESSLGSLAECAREGKCELPQSRMEDAFLTALSHPHPTARLIAIYSDYAWNVLDDKQLGVTMAEKAVAKSPNEPAYRITLVRMFISLGRNEDAKQQLNQLTVLNIGGHLDNSIDELRAMLHKS